MDIIIKDHLFIDLDCDHWKLFYLLFLCRELNQQFGIALSTANDVVKEVVIALCHQMEHYVKFPTCEEEMKDLAEQFGKYGYPNVIGAIDVTAINIQVHVPADHTADYMTRKHQTAINMTAVCDASKKFLGVNIGYSEKCHDSHIFQVSTPSII